MKNKLGFTLVELSAAMGVAGSLALVSSQEDRFELSQEQARSLGNEIYQYGTAVSRYLASYAGDSSITGTYTGSDWLKGSSCDGGIADEPFLACNILPNNKTIQFSSQPRTQVTIDTDGTLKARTVWDTIIGKYGEPDSMVMGTAAMVASGNYISQVGDAASGYQLPTIFCPETVGASASISDACDTDRNAIISMSNLNASVDPWLRTDHRNTMRHAIEFDPDGNTSSDAALKSEEDRANKSWLRQITNVSRIYNEAGVAGQSLTLGASSGDSVYSDPFLGNNSLLSGAVIVDADLAVMNSIYSKNDIFAERNAEIGNDLHVENNVTVNGSVSSQGNVVSSSGDINAVTGKMHAKRFVSVDDSSFFIDPDGSSNIESLDVSSTVTASSASVTGDVAADRLLLTGVRNEGNFCSPNGALARDSSGKILYCESSVWRSSVSGTPSGMYGYFNSGSCPDGWVKANGGNGTMDLRGRFIRAWDNGKGIDSGRSLGSYQGDKIRSHRHSMKVKYYKEEGSSIRTKSSVNTGPYRGSRTWKTNYSGGSETRPKNAALLACMKS